MTTEQLEKTAPAGFMGLAWVVSVTLVEFAMAVAGVGSALRLPVSLLFVLTVPGFLFLDLRQPRDPVARVIIGVGASLSVHLIVASVWLAPDPLWIAVAAVTAYLGLRSAFDLDAFGRRLRERVRPHGAPAPARPATDWVPLPPRRQREGASVVATDTDQPEPAAAPLPDQPERSDGMGRDVVSESEIEPGPNEDARADDDASAETENESIGSRPDPIDADLPGPSEAVAHLRPIGSGDLPDRIADPGQITAPAPPVISAASELDATEFVAAPPLLDINLASVSDFVLVPGIGETIAARVVEFREEHGPFESVDGLLGVSGIGRVRLDGIRDYVAVPVDGRGVWAGARRIDT